jgi:hypothetical protein
MLSNITLRIDDEILTKAKHRAVDHRMSLSAWVTTLVREKVEEDDAYVTARERAIKAMKKGFKLGGKPMSRDEIYDRKSLR